VSQEQQQLQQTTKRDAVELTVNLVLQATKGRANAIQEAGAATVALQQQRSSV
jgi:hypothetical protein